MVIAYNDMTLLREECFRRFGAVFDLPVLRGGCEELFHSLHKDDSFVLDFGCGATKPFKKTIDASRHNNKYYCIDKDLSAECDFESISEIHPSLQFDFIIANQVIEHMSFSNAFAAVSELFSVLKLSGHFIATVPNVSHPVRFLSHYDHVLPMAYSNLYALFRIGGYEVTQLWRYSKVKPTNFVDRFLARRMQKIYRIDWADSICLVARKPHSEGGAG